MRDGLGPPSFCRNYSTAVVHYRWAGSSPFEEVNETSNGTNLSASSEQDPDDELPIPREEDSVEVESDVPLNDKNTALHWPTPFFDTVKAYDWLLSNLATPDSGRRAVYACGSYLGAPLATALALTESRPDERMSVRGCIAFNGLYDWTTLLPDHPMNAPKDGSWPPPSDVFEGKSKDAGFRELRRRVPTLFGIPGNLFDPFASPSLFFYQPGLGVPQTFDEPTDFRDLWMLDGTLTPEQRFDRLVNAPQKPPKKSPRRFPPGKEEGDPALRIPEMLLLHTAPASSSAGPSRFMRPSHRRRQMRGKNKDLGMHTFRGQAEELAACARRSVNRFEVMERIKREDDLVGLGKEASQRVQICEVGPSSGHGDGEPPGLPAFGNDFAETWLLDRLMRDRGIFDGPA